MSVKHLLAKVLNKPLPTFPRPKCTSPACGADLLEPRPFHTEQQGAVGALTVHCLSTCPRCGAKHAGTRTIALGRQTRAVQQEFHLYNDDDAALVRSLLPKYQQQQSKLQDIHNMPVASE